MPTSGWELALYVLAIVPGVGFVWAQEGHRAVGKRSILRETAAVLAVSVLCNGLVLLVASVFVWLIAPAREFVLDRVREPSLLLAELPLVLIVAAVYFALSTWLAVLLGSERVFGRMLKRAFRSRIPRDTSAWASLLDAGNDREVRVALTLTSGTWISGVVDAFDNDPDPHPNRALILHERVRIKRHGKKTVTESPGWLIVEASAIEFMEVAYYEPDPHRTRRGSSSAPKASKPRALAHDSNPPPDSA